MEAVDIYSGVGSDFGFGVSAQIEAEGMELSCKGIHARSVQEKDAINAVVACVVAFAVQNDGGSVLVECDRDMTIRERLLDEGDSAASCVGTQNPLNLEMRPSNRSIGIGVLAKCVEPKAHGVASGHIGLRE